MSEKVLGFYEKDVDYLCKNCRCNYSNEECCPNCLEIHSEDCLEFYRKQQVPVVSVEWLEKWCKEQVDKYGLKGKSKIVKSHNELVAVYVKDLLSAVRKQAKAVRK